jgi:hypothetical protein
MLLLLLLLLLLMCPNRPGLHALTGDEDEKIRSSY